MLTQVKSPWFMALVIAVLTIIWVKWELSTALQSMSTLPPPGPSEPADPDDEDDEPMPQPQPQPHSQLQPQPQPEPERKVPPRTQERGPIAWQPGLPPAMPMAFTEVVEVEQDPLDIDDSAFETSE